MRAFGVVGVLITLLIAVVAGAIGYNLGIAANLPAEAGQVAYPVWGFGFGFPFFGFFFILFFVLIFGFIRRAAWGGRGPGGWGHYHGGPPMADDAFRRWHHKAHGEPEQDSNTR